MGAPGLHGALLGNELTVCTNSCRHSIKYTHNTKDEVKSVNLLYICAFLKKVAAKPHRVPRKQGRLHRQNCSKT